MDKLKAMTIQDLTVLVTYLMLFNNEKTIKQCHQDINKIITDRVKKVEDLKKCKIINMRDWKRAKEENI